MIKQIKRKFLLISMLSTFIVFFIMLSTINGINISSMIKNGYNTIHVLEMNDGKFPFNNQKDFMDKNPEEPFSSRFFVAVIDENSNIVSVNTDKIFAISENEAKDITTSLFNKNKVKGLYNNFLYRRQKINDTSYRYIFLDMTIQINSSKMFLFTSIIVSLISLALICVVFLFLAKLVIKPIEKNAIKQKQFITDATHEIKTPLTIIGADVEVLELINGENEWTNSIKNQTNRLSVMTKRLIYLAKAEENTNMTFSDVSLNNAINEVISSFSSILKTNNKGIVINDFDITYKCDEGALKELFSILIENAIKYSTDNSTIKINVTKANKITIIVENKVANMEEKDYSCLFDRFYRLDSSRNSSLGGSGIGLSIAKAIVLSFKGIISASCDDKNNFQVKIIF
ncbi:MAG: HAMP domain-containing sensor histidine kinase [Candidatus Caccosoma sp.]|nr:HAMP domain-containing sensor histidine kinase [Candidatus Caccosoma sp.]